MQFERALRRRRRVGLTALIDVVFLLLIFFMLATRFGSERVLSLAVATNLAGTESSVRVDVAPSGETRVDGRRATGDDLARVLAEALAAAPDRRVVVVPEAEVSLQQIAAALEGAVEAGATGATLLREF